RMPWTWTTDLKIRKDFRLLNLTYALFAEITNLFNVKNIQNVYPETGKIDDNMKLTSFDGYISTTWPSGAAEYVEQPTSPDEFTGYDERRDLDNDGQISKQEWYESYKMAYQDFLNDPYLYGEPRKIRVGVSVGF
ncbi:hypothetical protein KAU34_03020, partial [candidate division WOR-3 bacterium]|nr:hypothetical protein [candidate division WOR-3 bacterium]